MFTIPRLNTTPANFWANIWFQQIYAVIAFWLVAGALSGSASEAEDRLVVLQPEAWMQITSALESDAVKNGGKLSLNLLIASEYPIRCISGQVLDGKRILDQFPIAPNEMARAQLAERINPDSQKLLRDGRGYAGSWVAHGLEEKNYQLAIIIEDDRGRKLNVEGPGFSDPIAGVTTIGLPNYPAGGMLESSFLELDQDSHIYCGVIDEANGYMYLGAATYPGRIIKIDLGDGSSPPRRVGALKLEPGEDYLDCAAIDLEAGYAYFGTADGTGKIVMVRLGEGDELPERIGAVTLNAGEIDLRSLELDEVNRYLYVGTGNNVNTSRGEVIKLRVEEGEVLPTRLGALILEPGEARLECLELDVENGYGYIGNAMTGSLIRIKLGAGDDLPERISAISIGSSSSSFFDSDNRIVYFGINTSTPQIARFQLGAGDAPPIILPSIILHADDEVRAAAYDATNNMGYFAGDGTTNSGIITKVFLGDGINPPARIGFVNTLNHSAGPPGLADPSRERVYFVGGGDESSIGVVESAATMTTPTLTDEVALHALEHNLYCGVIDPNTGYAYYGTYTSPGYIVKVDLGQGSEPPKRLGAIRLDPSEEDLRCAIIDPEAGYAYFGTDTRPGRIIKIALGEGTAPPERVGTLVLTNTERALKCAVIDTESGTGYFASAYIYSDPAMIIKVNLGEGAALPTKIATLVLNPGEAELGSAVIDPANGFAYFGTLTNPGIVVKVALGGPLDPPTRIGSLTLNSSESVLESGVIDTVNQYAYFATRHSAARIIKVALGEGVGLPTRTAVLTLNPADKYPSCGIIDVSRGMAYWGSKSEPGRVLKTSLGEGASAPKREGVIWLGPGRKQLATALISNDGNYGYFASLLGSGENGFEKQAGVISKVSLHGNSYMGATKLTLSHAAFVDEVSFYSHLGVGNVGLAIYSEVAPRTLLWESGAIPNNATEAWLKASISAGVPNQLLLKPGTYRLAWQTDSHLNIASVALGSANQGMLALHEFGPAPTQLNGISLLNDDKWSQYISYQKNDAIVVSHTLSDPPSLTTGRYHYLGITMQNTGGTTWTLSDPNYYSLRVTNDDCAISVAPEVQLASDAIIAPGMEYQFNVVVLAPEIPAECFLGFRMNQNLIEGFGESLYFDLLIEPPVNTTRSWMNYE